MGEVRRQKNIYLNSWKKKVWIYLCLYLDKSLYSELLLLRDYEGLPNFENTYQNRCHMLEVDHALDAEYVTI